MLSIKDTVHKGNFVANQKLEEEDRGRSNYGQVSY